MSSNDIFSQAPDRRTAFRARMGAAAAALLLTGSLVGWTAAGSGVGNVAAAPTRAAAIAPESAAARTIGAGGDSYAPIVEQTAPAVVTIRSDRTVKTAQPGFAGRPALPPVLRRHGYRARLRPSTKAASARASSSGPTATSSPTTTSSTAPTM